MGGDAAFDRPVKSGIPGLLGRSGTSSTTPKFMISTMLDTSFLMLSGRDDGNDLPTSFKLQRYIARANSGKSSCPDLVVSARVLDSSSACLIYNCNLPFSYHICDNELPSNLDRISRSLDLSPDSVWPSPAADLNNVSNLAWSCAVMNDSLIFGIFDAFAFDVRRPRAGAAAGVALKLSAICAKPVG